MQPFYIGVNHWASHAGTDMWRDWQEDTVRPLLHEPAEFGFSL